MMGWGAALLDNVIGVDVPLSFDWLCLLVWVFDLNVDVSRNAALVRGCKTWSMMVSRLR